MSLLAQRQAVTAVQNDNRKIRNLYSRAFRDAGRMARRSGNPQHAMAAIGIHQQAAANGFRAGGIASSDRDNAYAGHQISQFQREQQGLFNRPTLATRPTNPAQPQQPGGHLEAVPMRPGVTRWVPESPAVAPSNPLAPAPGLPNADRGGVAPGLPNADRGGVAPGLPNANAGLAVPTLSGDPQIASGRVSQPPPLVSGSAYGDPMLTDPGHAGRIQRDTERSRLRLDPAQAPGIYSNGVRQVAVDGKRDGFEVTGGGKFDDESGRAPFSLTRVPGKGGGVRYVDETENMANLSRIAAAIGDLNLRDLRENDQLKDAKGAADLKKNMEAARNKSLANSALAAKKKEILKTGNPIPQNARRGRIAGWTAS